MAKKAEEEEKAGKAVLEKANDALSKAKEALDKATKAAHEGHKKEKEAQ